MPARKPNSIGRGDMVMIQGGPDDIAQGRVVRRVQADELDVLARQLSMTSLDQRSHLEDLTNFYYRDRAQDTAGAATKGERNASIQVMLKLVGRARTDRTGRSRMTLEAALDYADNDLAWDLTCAVALKSENGEASDAPISSLPLDEIEAALLSCLTSSRGPMPALGAERALIARLVQMYEASTGQIATHNPKVMTQYTGLAESQAGRFVTAAAKLIDPDLNGTKVTNLMAAWLKRRRDADARARSNSAKQAA